MQNAEILSGRLVSVRDALPLIPAEVRKRPEVAAAIRTLLGTDGKDSVTAEAFGAAGKLLERAINGDL
ncbi:hypothetical protein HY213_02220 [Candidatus Peregrinibacteria bacterium]|nr:hypothetical protein [Candidatus Peregrinibacteria bacterium]